MSTTARLTGAEFDAMVERGAFDSINPKKVELINGELKLINPAGPIHDDYIEFLAQWSVRRTVEGEFNIRVQSGFVCDDNRPEPDVLWLRPDRYGRTRPTSHDVRLLIEVSDSSLANDLREKAEIYASAGVLEYWVVDIPNQRIHVMSDIENSLYRSIQICTPPKTLAPRCKPEALLDTERLFEVH